MSDYSSECAAGRRAAVMILAEAREGGDLPLVVKSIREAVFDGDEGHGIGFLYAIAATAIGCCINEETLA